MSDIKKIFGIDSLYYFAESNENYDELFLDILDQVEEIKGRFEKREIKFQNLDVNITIKDISLQYLGCSEGFYWFKDFNEFFKIGFKDKLTNRKLNDIRVQLQGVGIYTIGIKSLLELINKDLLDGYVNDYFPITRADLNCFIQYDFSFLTKDMFSTRKRNYATISEIGNATSLQTIYIGKEPFKLRIYNKKEELKKSKKKDLMYEYFLNNNFNLEDHIFNIEFELHRTHLRQYQILTVEDLLLNAVKLFKTSMEDIRLIDKNAISKNTLKNNKYKTPTLDIWDEIKNSYKLDDFLQTTLDLKRIKRAISIYDENKFTTEFIILLRKGFINSINIDLEFINTLFTKAKDSLNKTTSQQEIKKRYIEVEIINEKDCKKETLRLLEDGRLIEPVDVISVSTLSDYELMRYYESTLKDINLSQYCSDIYEVAKKEMLKRELIPNIASQIALDDEEVNEYGF